MATTTSITTRALAGISLLNGIQVQSRKVVNTEENNLTLKRWEEYCSLVVAILLALLGLLSSVLVIGSCGVFQTTYQPNNSLSEEPQRADSLRMVYVGVFRLSTVKTGSSSDQCVPFSSLTDWTGWDEVVNNPLLSAAQSMAILSPCIATLATFLLLPFRCWRVPLSSVGLLYTVAVACQIFVLIFLELVEFCSGEGPFGTCQWSSGGGWTCAAALFYVGAIISTWMIRRCRQKADRLDRHKHVIVDDPILHLVVPSHNSPNNAGQHDPNLTSNNYDVEIGSTDAHIDPYANLRPGDISKANTEDTFPTNPIAEAKCLPHSEEVSVITTNTFGGNTFFINDANDANLALSMIAATSLSSSSTATSSSSFTIGRMGLNPSLVMPTNHLQIDKESQTRNDDSMEEISYLMFPNLQMRDGCSVDHDETENSLNVRSQTEDDPGIVDPQSGAENEHCHSVYREGDESTVPMSHVDIPYMAPDDEQEDYLRSLQSSQGMSSINMEVVMDDQTLQSQSLSLPVPVTHDSCLNQDETSSESHDMPMESDDTDEVENDGNNAEITLTENGDEATEIIMQEISQTSFFDACEMMNEIDHCVDNDTTTESSLGIYQFSELQLDDSLREIQNVDDRKTPVILHNNDANPTENETSTSKEDDQSTAMIEDQEGEHSEERIHHEPGGNENDKKYIEMVKSEGFIESTSTLKVLPDNETTNHGDESQDVMCVANPRGDDIVRCTDDGPNHDETNQSENTLGYVRTEILPKVANIVNPESTTAITLHPSKENEDNAFKVIDKETRHKKKKKKKHAKLIPDVGKENCNEARGKEVVNQVSTDSLIVLEQGEIGIYCETQSNINPSDSKEELWSL